MDIGTAGYTEYEFGPDFVKFLTSRRDLLKMYKGHCHSHNNMSVFFSGTDQGEIHDNSEFHNYYLSLIVNNANDMVAKICFRGTQKSVKIQFKNEKGEKAVVTTDIDEDAIFEWECDITKPGKVTTEGLDGFDERMTELKSHKKKKSWWKRPTNYTEFSGRDEDKSIDWRKADKHMQDFSLRIMAAGKEIEQGSNISEEVSKLIGRSETCAKIVENVKVNLKKMYKESFNDDPEFKKLNDRVEEFLQLLEGTSKYYSYTAPKLKKEIMEALNLKPEEEEDDEYKGYHGGYGPSDYGYYD